RLFLYLGLTSIVTLQLHLLKFSCGLAQMRKIWYTILLSKAGSLRFQSEPLTAPMGKIERSGSLPAQRLPGKGGIYYEAA
ncbi:MAG: hypothetical protein LUF77_01980, partial [Oscillospiraceae bacterium]|nr:hypothetical protein [Oscillospiraceae bacterium]